jgi:hypothetical protein
MDTSKSPKEDPSYTAGASIFSGRPDPTWSLSEEAGRNLLQLFDALEKHDGPTASAPPLGYRGVFFRDNAGHEWFAYREVVTLTGPNSREARKDAGRQFERAIVSSAPQGLIPAALLAQEFE